MHGPSCRIAMLALALAVATPAAAASKLSIAPFGTKGAAATAQVEAALCARLECVPWDLVSTRGLKDLAKARAQGVGGLLVGGTFDRAGKQLLGVNLYTSTATAVRSWSFPLGPDGLLKAADLAGLQAGVLGVVPAAAAAKKAAGPAAKKPVVSDATAATPGAEPLAAAPTPVDAEPPAPAKPATRAAAKPKVEPKAKPDPKASAARKPAAAAPAAAPPKPAAPPDASAAGQPPGSPPRPMKDAFAWPKPPRDVPRTHPYVAVELGALVTDRHLTYSGGTGGALQAFDVSLFTSPRGRVELYPLAASEAPLLAGLGVFGDYAHSVGLKTVVGSTKSDTTFARLRAGLLWKVPVAETLTLVPALSYETLQLSVSPAVAGLPDADLSGVKAGVGVEWTVHPRWKVLAGGGYLRWTSAKDLVKGSPVFFPGGSAAALEAEAGAAFSLAGPFSVRLVGEYSRTSYTLKTDTTGTYLATGATDASLGFRAMLRAEF